MAKLFQFLLNCEPLLQLLLRKPKLLPADIVQGLRLLGPFGARSLLRCGVRGVLGVWPLWCSVTSPSVATAFGTPLRSDALNLASSRARPLWLSALSSVWLLGLCLNRPLLRTRLFAPTLGQRCTAPAFRIFGTRCWLVLSRWPSPTLSTLRYSTLFGVWTLGPSASAALRAILVAFLTCLLLCVFV